MALALPLTRAPILDGPDGIACLLSVTSVARLDPITDGFKVFGDERLASLVGIVQLAPRSVQDTIPVLAMHRDQLEVDGFIQAGTDADGIACERCELSNPKVGKQHHPVLAVGSAELSKLLRAGQFTERNSRVNNSRDIGNESGLSLNSLTHSNTLQVLIVSGTIPRQELL